MVKNVSVIRTLVIGNYLEIGVWLLEISLTQYGLLEK